MKIYLMRHGEAEPFGQDKDRILSTAGKNDVNNLSHFLKQQPLKVTHFFHSNKMRAIETASIMSTAIHSTYPMTERQELDSDASIQLLLTELPAWEGNVFLVGHMPYMGKLASYLSTANENLAHFAIEPGCLLCLESAGYKSQWQLAWMINPRRLLQVTAKHY